MACIERIYSVSALVGNGSCNAKCKFCAARDLRPTAIMQDPVQKLRYDRNLEAAIKLSARYGGWSLSLTGSGEPTCDPDAVTDALGIYARCAAQGAYMPNVNLFTNGILLGDVAWCKAWLPRWRALGLTNVAVSLHDIYMDAQAEMYGLASRYDYPTFTSILENVRRYGSGIGVRITLLLHRGLIDNAERYYDAVDYLTRGYMIDNITSWPIGNPDGTRNASTPSRWGMFGIRRWLQKNARLCHGHAWGGGVYDYKGNILRLTDYVTPHDPGADFVRQLVVFQDGTVSYSWIRQGALCMK